MASDDPDAFPILKILLIGPSGAGKSALLTRYCDDHFEPDSSTATIGIDFKIKKVSVRGKGYKLTLFDTAGQERFRTLSTSFYRGAHGVILVYDITSRSSFQSLDKWFEEAETNTISGAALYLVGAKLDKAETSRAVSTEEGLALAQAHGARFCEASAKTRENIRRPFVEIVDQILAKPDLLSAAGSIRRPGSVALTNAPTDEASWSGCSC